MAHIFCGPTLIFFPTTTTQEIVLIEDENYTEVNGNKPLVIPVYTVNIISVKLISL